MNKDLFNHDFIMPDSFATPQKDWEPDTTVATNRQGYMDIDAVQRVLNRSRASVYRYANTDPGCLNMEYDPQKLNPELRQNRDEPLKFDPNEVARFARDVLGIKQVLIEKREPTENATNAVLREILAELRHIRHLLENQQS